VYALRRGGSAWDGLQGGSVLVVVLVNKNLVSIPGQVPVPANETDVTLCLPAAATAADGAAGSAFLERLSAVGGAAAETGITLAGQTFDGATDGTMRGQRVREALQPAAGQGPCAAGTSAYLVSMPAESSAVVYVPLA